MREGCREGLQIVVKEGWLRGAPHRGSGKVGGEEFHMGVKEVGCEGLHMGAAREGWLRGALQGGQGRLVEGLQMGVRGGWL